MESAVRETIVMEEKVSETATEKVPWIVTVTGKSPETGIAAVTEKAPETGIVAVTGKVSGIDVRVAAREDVKMHVRMYAKRFARTFVTEIPDVRRELSLLFGLTLGSMTITINGKPRGMNVSRGNLFYENVSQKK